MERSVLTIAASDPCAGAGIQADLKTFLALGVPAASVLTAVTVQNTQGVRELHPLPPSLIENQLRALLEDLDVEWGKTGVLCSKDIVRLVERYADRINLVVDPILRASSGYPLLEENAIPELKKLVGKAWVVTPNVHEAEVLTGVRIRDKEDAKRAARELFRLGVHAVVIKGGHLPGKPVDILFDGKNMVEFTRERIDTKLHGSGCVFSAALTAELSKGFELKEAVERSIRFICTELERPLRIGKGASVTGFWELERKRAVEEVYSASVEFISHPENWRLVPEVGTNIVMALCSAKTPSEVVGLEGRIVRVGEKITMTGFPKLGGSEHVARAVVTLMRFDSRMRGGMNVRYFEGVEKACRNLGLTVAEFSRREEPKGVKTMEWGIESAVKKAGRVPQVIFDRGAPGKEAMVRIFGRTPLEVVEIARRLAQTLEEV
jgi:hydroxymethylpyrimidine kinase/phosphomethylpyrimidine kinase